MTTERVDLHLEGVEGAELRGFGTRGGLLKVSGAGGALTVDVSGRDAVELTRNAANLNSISWTGWYPSTDVQQVVTVKIVQDATGGRTLDPFVIEGQWNESPPTEFDQQPGDTMLRFTASTCDAGATVELDPIGVAYTNDCIQVQGEEIDVPVVSANGTIEIGHNFGMVTSVELIRQSSGRRVLADWWQVGANAAAPVNIDFLDPHPAGTFKARVAGMTATPCALTVSASPWETADFSVNAGTVQPNIGFSGPAGSVQWVWNDGSPVETALNNVVTPHVYAANGTATLRWRKGTSITHFIDSFGRWTFDVGLLPSTRTNLNVGNGLAALTGNVAGLPRGLTSIVVRGSNTLTGQVSDLPPALTLLRLYGLNSLSGDVSGFSVTPSIATIDLLGNNTISGDVGAFTGITSLTSFTVGGNNTLGGLLSGFPGSVTVISISGNNTLTGSIGGVTASPLVTLNVTGNNTLSGDIGLLPASVATVIVSGNNLLTGDVTGLPPNLAEFNVSGSNTISGVIADAPSGGALATFILAGNNTLGGDIGSIPASVTRWSLTGTGETATLTLGTFTPNAGLVRFVDARNLTEAMVDEILIKIEALGTSPAGALVDVGGINAPPSATGEAAAVTLEGPGRNWSVTRN